MDNASKLTVQLTHWGRVMHICVSKLAITGSDNGLSPGRRQAVIWTNVDILLIGLLGTKSIEILIEIDAFSLKKMRLKVPSGNWRPFCLGLNVELLIEKVCFGTLFEQHIAFWCIYVYNIFRARLQRRLTSGLFHGTWSLTGVWISSGVSADIRDSPGCRELPGNNDNH